MAEKVIDFYWDIGSTNTYFALHLIRPIAARHGARLVLHPFNLGYVFRHHNYALTQEPRAKIRNRIRDLERWTERYRLPFRMPDTFPIKTSRALRGAIAMRKWEKETAYIDEIFRRYWEQNDAAIADYAGLREVVAALGVDAAAFEAEAESEPVRQALIDSTQAGLARGVFGAPSFIVKGELYWGKDRMDFIEDALAAG
ncbi:MAG: 2-hydroxychromene-2-carboxylate isomerase [Alphaproteobacteria bacterium]|jgi:2-hydroxychromene-2-carboxylate isomerase|nr:2-hydroxychromene-2-carboxylate isomerase [Alphaproteobacteria bacterium]